MKVLRVNREEQLVTMDSWSSGEGKGISRRLGEDGGRRSQQWCSKRGAMVVEVRRV